MGAGVVEVEDLTRKVNTVEVGICGRIICRSQTPRTIAQPLGLTCEGMTVSAGAGVCVVIAPEWKVPQRQFCVGC